MKRRSVTIWVFGLTAAGGLAWMIAATSASSGSPQDLPDEHQRIDLVVDQRPRQYVVYAPANPEDARPRPLVMMLHGMGGTAANIMAETGWSAKAATENFIIVYPEATRPSPGDPPHFRKNPQGWNDGSGRFDASATNVNDIAYIEALINDVSSKHAIDSRQIYVAGFSNGGSMAFRIGEALSQRVVAIAVSGSACWNAEVTLRRGVSLLYMSGRSDPLNPIDGGVPRLRLGSPDSTSPAKPSVARNVEVWADALDLSPRDFSERKVGAALIRESVPGRDGAIIQSIWIDHLGHHWPGGVGQAPAWLVGPSNDAIDATDVCWRFFQTASRQ